MTPPHLSCIRSATAAEHRRLEADLDLLRDGVDLDEYRRVLERFYAFLLPWEQALPATLVDEVPALSAHRGRTAWLADDLRDLGARPVTLRAAVAPYVSIASALGAMYVVEGSTLGGQVLSRHFAARLGTGPHFAGRYFSGYGVRTGAMWTSFVAALAARPEAEIPAMCASATETFRALREWLCASAPGPHTGRQ